MENKEAIEMLERFQNPEPWEPQITSRAYEALEMAIAALKKQEQTIEFIETRKKLHSSPAWYEFAIVKELDEVKRFVEKIDREE